MITQAVIICGGKGERLLPITRDHVAKCMVDIGCEPLLHHQIDALFYGGIGEIILIAGHRHESIYTGENKDWKRIKWHVDSKGMGTAGYLVAIREQLHDTFLVVYGDVFWDPETFDIRDMVEHHDRACSAPGVKKRLGPIATLAVRASDHPWDSDLMELDSDGYVKAFIPAPHAPTAPNVANVGIYVVSKALATYTYIDHGKPNDFIKDVLPAALEEREGVFTYQVPETAFVKDIGTPARLMEARQYVMERELIDGFAMNRKPIDIVFADLDGTLVPDGNVGWLPVTLLPGVLEALQNLKAAGFRVFVITNQPKLAYPGGVLSFEAWQQYRRWLLEAVPKNGGDIENVFVCPHHPETHHGGDPRLRRACRCRKPRTGLIMDAVREYDLDLGRACIFGDSWRDVQCGHAAKIPSIYISPIMGALTPGVTPPSLVVASFAEAADCLIKTKGQVPIAFPPS